MSILNFFKQQVDNNETVVIKVSSPTCGPCKVMQPMFDKLSSDYPSNYYVNLESNEDDPELSDYIKNELKVSTVPTFIVLHKGVEINRVVGAKPYSQLVHSLALDPNDGKAIINDQTSK